MTQNDDTDALKLSPLEEDRALDPTPGLPDLHLGDDPSCNSNLDVLETSFREILTASFSRSKQSASEEEQEQMRQGYLIVDMMSSLRESIAENSPNNLIELFGEDMGGISEWEEGVAVIESILLPQSSARQALSSSQIVGLRKVQQLLWAGPRNTDAHIPRALLSRPSGSTSDYILSQFAGIKRVNAKQKVFNVFNANRFLLRLKQRASTSQRLRSGNKEAFVPKEWTNLGLDEQVQLADLLSWEKLQKWDFDVFEIDRLTHGQPLMFVGWAIFASPYSQFVMAHSVYLLQERERAVRVEGPHEQTTPAQTPPIVDDMPGYGFTDEFKIPQENLVNFLSSVEKVYVAENPYHNNIHAADVVQSLHSILQSMDAKVLAMAEIELLSLLLAAVVHDMGHPGLNNSFQVNSHSELAIQYNDQSVLENMHASLAFRFLLGSHKDATMDIFAGMTHEQMMASRKMIIESVLDTDMTKHFSTVNKIKGIRLSYKDITANSSSSSAEGDITYKNGDAWQILHFALHLADISNPAKPLNLAIQWTDRCLEEFFQQGDEEKRLGLPVSPLCDRTSTQREDSQIGFIKFVVQPAFELLGKIVPEVQRQILPILETNLQYWVEQKAEGQKAGLAEASDRSEASTQAMNDESME